MSRLTDTFEHLRANGTGGLIVFVTAGDPSLQVTAELAPAIADAGADVIEIGMPFSDPLADGPVIQAASQRSLDRGTTTRRLLNCVQDIRRSTDVPLVLMGSYNPVLQFGPDEFAARARDVGADGVILSDLPPSESDRWVRAAHAHALDTIFLVAPTSTPERIRDVVERCTGFVYCVSRTGVTGARDVLPDDLVDTVGRIRQQTDEPIAVGFGIKSAAHVAAVNRIANAAVVGSAIVQLIGERAADGELIEVVRAFVGDLAQGKRP